MSETLTIARRGFLTNAAAFAAAGTAIVLSAPVAPARATETTAPATGIDWEQWELELGYACSHVTFFDDEIALADKAFKRWEARNPWPSEPVYGSYAERMADFQRIKSAQSAHCERYQNALKQCGRGALKLERNKAFGAYAVLCERIAELPVRTLSDLKEKSRLARFEYAGGPIRRALSDDLVGL